MAVSRRQLLAGGAAGVGLAVAGTVPTLGITAAEAKSGAGPGGSRPFPPLVDDPDGILALPDGFRYRIVARAGETDLDGGVGKTPGRQDQLFFDGEFSEFTGPNFSPDGSMLFVNIQEPGITLAITGPWAAYLGG